MNPLLLDFGTGLLAVTMIGLIALFFDFLTSDLSELPCWVQITARIVFWSIISVLLSGCLLLLGAVLRGTL